MDAKVSRQERRAAERLAKKNENKVVALPDAVPVSEMSKAISTAKAQIPGGNRLSTKMIKKLLSGPKAQELLQQPEFAELAKLL